MHHGDPYAAFCLLQRRRALAGIKKNGWAFKVRAMNAARLRKREDRIQAAAVFDERRRVKAEYGLTAATLALLRASRLQKRDSMQAGSTGAWGQMSTVRMAVRQSESPHHWSAVRYGIRSVRDFTRP